MTTDKERAETWRRIADCYESLGKYSIAAADARRRADELDPPKPEWLDGTIAWVTNSHQRTYLCQWCETEDNWCIGGPDGDSVPGSVTKVEPLRVLADDEIALPVVTKMTGQLRDDADQLDGSNGYGNPSAAVLRAYADALDAEAGEQS